MTDVATRSIVGVGASPLTDRAAPHPRPGAVRVATLLVGLGFGAVVGQGVSVGSWSQLRSPGGAEIFAGSLAGLAGTYLALVMVLLVSRIPIVEHVLGQDGLVRLHRRVAPWPLSLLGAHAVLLTAGYAAAARSGLLREAWSLVSSFPDVLAATVGLGLLAAVAVASIGVIRRRLTREQWWAVHLTVYLALGLSFAHTIGLGPSFVGHPLARAAWSILWALTAGAVVWCRALVPLWRSLRHRLRVVRVRVEAPDVVSVVLRGRNVERLAVAGGQFFEWRFLTRGMWWQAHPFSLSAMPRPPYLRITVKTTGDFTSMLRDLRPGTWVAIEGPYGAFTAHARRRRKVAMFAGGIGVTAVRALLEDLPASAAPIVVLRASTHEGLALHKEVHELARRRMGQVHEVVGSRHAVAVKDVVGLVRDIRHRDVYVSGSDGFVRSVLDALRAIGVPEECLHAEAFAL